MERECKRHGLTEYSKYGAGWRCRKCEVERKKRMRDETKAFVNSLKDQPCADCNQNWPAYVMDFHHRDKQEKIFKISKAIVSMSRERLIEEIEKCDLLCANCHRIREYLDVGKLGNPRALGA
jgi:hypothetical protein